jgi:hypothetical protein
MPTDSTAKKFSLSMAPLVIDTAFAATAGNDVRQQLPSVIDRSVTLDEGAGYMLRYLLGDTQESAAGGLQIASGDGLLPLRQAEAGGQGGVNYYGEVSLKSNEAWYGAARITGENAVSKSVNVAAYEIANAGSDGAALLAYFNMKYVPFAKFTDDKWLGRAANFKTPLLNIAGNDDIPTWVIRNGLNDAKQNDLTNFASYVAANAGSGSPNANGGIPVFVKTPAPAIARVNALNITGLVTAPVAGALPVTTANSGVGGGQWTAGAVTWYERTTGSTAAPANFADSKVYRAVVTLTAAGSWTFAGLPANQFADIAASWVINPPVDSGNTVEVTIIFPAITAAGQNTPVNIVNLVTFFNLTGLVTAPATAASTSAIFRSSNFCLTQTIRGKRT